MTARQPCFQRFQSPDPAALAEEVRRDAERLEQARHARDELAQLELLTSIGGATIILGHEDEAVPIIKEALALAEKREDKNYEILNLLNLATARQYLDQRDMAQTLFQQALDQCHVYGVRDYEDFVWHHRGRCYVEQGKIDEARACFERALALREEKGEQRFTDSTRRALASLDQPLDTILGTSISISLEPPDDATDN